MEEVLTYIGSIAPGAAICLVLGIVLVIIEMFTPGFTVPGATGLVLILVGIILTADTFLEALILLLVILALLSIALFIVIRSASKGALNRTIIKKDNERDYVSVDDMNFFVGKEGVALTVLRPAGTCDFNGVRLDVVTEGFFVEKGTKVKVIRVEGRRILVEPLTLDN
jgi:membrane-bound ClpP family serine protease